MHVVAFVDDQESDDVAPAATADGVAVSVITGAGGNVTVMVSVDVAVSPVAAAQVMVNDVVVVIGLDDCDPEVPRGPDHPPDAEQDVVLLDVQDKLTDVPAMIVV